MDNQDIIYVQTPFGTLYAKPSGDYDPLAGEVEYPGIEIGLIDPNRATPVCLALLEALKDASPACSFAPGNPRLMEKELNEVPESRREYRFDVPCITPGLVLHSWQIPESLGDELLHHRTIYELST